MLLLKTDRENNLSRQFQSRPACAVIGFFKFHKLTGKTTVAKERILFLYGNLKIMADSPLAKKVASLVLAELIAVIFFLIDEITGYQAFMWWL